MTDANRADKDMQDANRNNSEASADGLERLFSLLLDGQCSQEQWEELVQALRDNIEAQDRYITFMALHGHLIWRLDHRLPGPTLPSDSDAPAAKPRIPSMGNLPALRPWVMGMMALAVVVAVGFAIGLSGGGGAAATLTRSLQATWDPARAATNAEPLAAGRQLVLQEGLAEITFAQGAKLTLQGPVSLTITNSNAARLESGQLTADVPPAATGFTLDVPTGKIIDRGTRFGVIVDPLPAAKKGKLVEVHVLKGKVEVETEAQRGASSTVTKLAVNEALRGDTATKALQRIPARPDEFIQSLNDSITFQRDDILVDGPGRTIRRVSDGAFFAAGPDPKNNVYALAFSADTSALYMVASRWRGRGTISTLVRIDVTDPRHPRQVGGFRWGTLLTGAPDGTLLACDTEQRDQRPLIVRFDPAQNHRRTDLAKLPGNCTGLVASPTGEIYVAVAKQFVARIDSAKGTLNPVVFDVDPIGLVVDPASGDLLVGVAMAAGGMEIRRYSLTKDQATLRETLKLEERVGLLAVTDHGMILATPQKGSGLWQIDPRSGQRSLVYSGATRCLAIYRPAR